MAKIVGVLRDPLGRPFSCKIELVPECSPSSVIASITTETMVNTDGHYELNAPPGKYNVIITVSERLPICSAKIIICDESHEGDLNSFLIQPEQEDLRPDMIRPSPKHIDDIQLTTEKIKPINMEISQENSAAFFSNTTEAMLQLERPEIESENITIKIKENIDYDYIGPISGQCNVKNPHEYRIDMFMHTTEEYRAKDPAYLDKDGKFSFNRTWPGAKQFRLIKIANDEWITTLEFPLLIRSYWMPKTANPDVYNIMKDRTYTYDQAVATLALMVQGDKYRKDIERLVYGLSALVENNQSDPTNIGGVRLYVNRLSALSLIAYYRLGNAAWVYYALAFYLWKFPDGDHIGLVKQKLRLGLSWLERFKVTTKTAVNTKDLRVGLYKAGRGRFIKGYQRTFSENLKVPNRREELMSTIKILEKNHPIRSTEDYFESDYEAPWCALEHNIDIWFLFDLLATLNYSEGGDNYAYKRDQLGKAIIDKMWLEQEGRFTQGVYPHSLDTAAALDQSSWGGLFVANIDKNKAKNAHMYMERFRYETAEASGYTPYHPRYGYPLANRGVWVEGTAGVALFERKLGNDKQAIDLLVKLSPLMDRKYGYRDSSDSQTDDVLPDWPQTANTAWVILACKPEGFWKVNASELDIGRIKQSN